MKGSVRLIESNVTENGNMDEVIRTEVGEDAFVGDWNEQPFSLLLRVSQLNSKPLPIGGFTRRAISQMLHEVAGVIPRGSSHE